MKKRFLGIVSFVLAAMLMVMPVYAATGSSASADWTQKGDEEYSYEVFNFSIGLSAVFRITRKPFSTTFPKVEEIIQEEDKKLFSAYIECEDGHTTVSKEDISKIFKYADSENFSFGVFGIEQAKGKNGSIACEVGFLKNTIPNAVTSKVTLNENEEVSKKLADVKDKVYALWTYEQKGYLPSSSSISIWHRPSTPFETEVQNDKSYLYRYDEVSGLFVYMNQDVFYETDNDQINTEYIACNGITQGGTYVVTKEALPEVLTKKAAIVVDAGNTKEELKTNLLQELNKSTVTSGSVLEVTVPKNVVVDKSIFEKAKEKGVGLSLLSTSGTPVKWEFGSIDNAVEFDTTVNVGADIKEVSSLADTFVEKNKEMKYSTVSFSFDGKLPGKAEVQLDLSSTNFADGDEVYLYYYNPTTKEFEEVDSGKFVNGFATFSMEHCSDYIVTDEKLVKETEEAQKPGKLGDVTGLTTSILIVMLGCGVLGLVLYRRKKNA